MDYNLYDLTQTGTQVQEILDAVKTFDTAPTEGSAHPVTSGGIYTAIRESTGNRVLAEAVAWLHNRVLQLEATLDKIGDATAQNIDFANMPKLVGMDWITFGTTAPSITPTCMGQIYVDTTNRAVYIAKAVTLSTSDWQAI